MIHKIQYYFTQNSMSTPTFPFEGGAQIYNATQNKTQLSATETDVLVNIGYTQIHNRMGVVCTF